jgi:hypothetical protein
MHPDVRRHFNHFAGREIPLKEESFKKGRRTYRRLALANPDNPVLRDMQQTAKQNGLSLRLLWPGAIATKDLRSDRVNAHLEQDAAGTWRVSSKFTIG